MENLFEEATVKAVIKKANPQSLPGPSGRRYSLLQAALCDELVEYLAAFTTFVFSSRVLTQVFWTLQTSANFSTPRQNADQWRAVMSWRCFLPPIRQEAGRLLPALGPVRRSSFRWSRDNSTHSTAGF